MVLMSGSNVRYVSAKTAAKKAVFNIADGLALNSVSMPKIVFNNEGAEAKTRVQLRKTTSPNSKAIPKPMWFSSVQSVASFQDLLINCEISQSGSAQASTVAF